MQEEKRKVSSILRFFFLLFPTTRSISLFLSSESRGEVKMSQQKGWKRELYIKIFQYR
jgi:hypothetical protein